MTETRGVDLRSVVAKALATELKVSERDVIAARSLKTEYKMDSIAAVNVAFAIEEECNIELDLDENDQFDSVDAIVAIVEKAMLKSVCAP